MKKLSRASAWFLCFGGVVLLAGLAGYLPEGRLVIEKWRELIAIGGVMVFSGVVFLLYDRKN